MHCACIMECAQGTLLLGAGPVAAVANKALCGLGMARHVLPWRGTRLDGSWARHFLTCLQVESETQKCSSSVFLVGALLETKAQIPIVSLECSGVRGGGLGVCSHGGFVRHRSQVCSVCCASSAPFHSFSSSSSIILGGYYWFTPSQKPTTNQGGEVDSFYHGIGP